MRLPTFYCYDGQEDQEEGSKDSQYTLQICIRSLESL
jgi:hypothetical protein